MTGGVRPKCGGCDLNLILTFYSTDATLACSSRIRIILFFDDFLLLEYSTQCDAKL